MIEILLILGSVGALAVIGFGAVKAHAAPPLDPPPTDSTIKRAPLRLVPPQRPTLGPESPAVSDALRRSGYTGTLTHPQPAAPLSPRRQAKVSYKWISAKFKEVGGDPTNVSGVIDYARGLGYDVVGFETAGWTQPEFK